MTKNDESWQRFFDNSLALAEIEEKGFCYVTADELKRLGRREPRLMAKHDTWQSCPKVFKKNQLAIFPVRNGQYVIFRDPQRKSFYDFPSNLDEQPAQTFNSAIELNIFDAFSPNRDFNESQAIDFAFIASLTQFFVQDNELQFVIRNRTFSQSFQFNLPNSGALIPVSGVQIEVDAGYESPKRICLIEAKIGARSDFHIRQLYYPYLEWSSRSNKQIVPIFLVYTNGKYHLTQFDFTHEFGSLEIVKQGSYVINESPLAQINLVDLLAQTSTDSEMEPFPQANDLDKVVDLVLNIGDELNTKEQIADFFDFDERQGDYYANVGCYLGFMERYNRQFQLTEYGRDFVQIRSLPGRTEVIIRALAQHPTFHEIFQLLVSRELKPDSISNNEIAGIIADNTNLGGSTPLRRASTVRAWLLWIFRNSKILAE